MGLALIMMQALLQAVMTGSAPTKEAGSVHQKWGPCPSMYDAYVGAIECVTVHVDADLRPSDAGGSDSIFVVRRSGAAGASKAPTVVFLPGGPGLPGSHWLDYAITAIGDAGATHDIIVFDQIGTGRSSGHRCIQQFGGDQRYALEAVATCRPNRPDHVDRYSSAAAADQIESLRDALGIDSLVLYGVSSGARVAMLYAIRYPARVSRMILHSPVTLGPWLPFAPDAEIRAFQAVQGACGRDPRCCREARDADQLLASALKRVRMELPRIRVLGATRVASTIRLTQRGLANLLREALYKPEEWQQAIRLLTAAAAGDWETVGAIAAFVRDEDAERNLLSQLAVMCNEDDGTFLARARHSRTAMDWSFVFVDDVADACDAWPQKQPATYPGTGALTMPVLVFTGQLDIVTPHESWGDPAFFGTHARLRLVHDAGHGSIWECMVPTVSEFIKRSLLPISATDGCSSVLQRTP